MKYKHLYHYYEKTVGPFRNLSALGQEEAESVLKSLKREGTVFASKRSDDYMRIRRQLEERARQLFVANGGKPAKTYPHYMTFGPCEWFADWYKSAAELKIPVDDFDPKTISFTYGDLFPTMRLQDGKPYRGTVYTIEEIVNVINEFGWPQDWNPDGSNGPERYIEVQVWDDRAIAAYL